MNHQLKPVNLRLGISDGTNTELLSTELQQDMEVVTGVTGLGTTRAAARPGRNRQSADARRRPRPGRLRGGGGARPMTWS